MTGRCLIACMPFVNVEVVSVDRPGEIIFSYIQLEDIPTLINRWINTKSLLSVQQRPLAHISEESFTNLLASLEYYRTDYSNYHNSHDESITGKLGQDILACHSQLVVAKVLKIFYSNIQMEPGGHTHTDSVFQEFMLTLYTNFRKHREVDYYARRSGLSVKYFATVVRRISGMSPSKWIERVVVGEAASLLQVRQRTIKEIASALNFPDAPTFSKYFLRVTGSTPKSYRQSLFA